MRYRGRKVTPPTGWNRRKKHGLHKAHDLHPDDMLEQIWSIRHEGGKNYASSIPKRRVVIDCDSREAIADLEALHGGPLDTFSIDSPSGRHYYFHLPKGAVVRTQTGGSVLGPKIDLLGQPSEGDEGGERYVLGPGCILSPEEYLDKGKPVPPGPLEYRVSADSADQINPIPQTLLDRIVGGQALPAVQGAGAKKGPCKLAVHQRGRFSVATWAPERIGKGSRDNYVWSRTVNILAKKLMRGEQITEALALAIAQRINAQLAEPLPPQQIARKGKTLLRWAGQVFESGRPFGSSHYTPAQRKLGQANSLRKRQEESLALAMRALELREQGHSYRQIAEIMGSTRKGKQGSCGTAWRRVQRALAARAEAARIMALGASPASPLRQEDVVSKRNAPDLASDPTISALLTALRGGGSGAPSTEPRATGPP